MSNAQREEIERFIGELLSASDHVLLIEEYCTFEKTLNQYLGDLLTKLDLKKSKVIADSGLNTTFGYPIFSGARNPSRDKVISLAFAMSLTIEQAQVLLYCAGINGLYAKNRRDALIIWGLNRGESLAQMNEHLYSVNEHLLSNF